MIKFVTIFMVLVLTMTCPAALAATSGEKFPLGKGAPEVSRKRITPGVVHRVYRHGTQRWTACVHAGSRRKARKFSRRVGAGTRTEKISRPRIADLPGRIFGYRVCVGRWQKKSRAIRARKRFRKVKPVPYVRQAAKSGPWHIHTITVKPRRNPGRFRASVGRSVADREPTSAMAKRLGAVAAVNGGFFKYRSKKAPGAPKGISVVGGQLLREGRKGGTALVMRGSKARITELTAKVKVTAANGATTRVNAVNRPIRKGERLGWFTPEYGRRPRKGRSVAGGDGVVRGRGAGKAWLKTNPGPYAMTVRVKDERAGRSLELDADTNVVSGGVAVVRRGRKWINGKANGVTATGMIAGRHPRTLAGVDKRGRLILVTVDGRQPGFSVGTTLPESARLMKWLGAKDAINLDGGGSTTMVIRGRVVNRPSDGRERTVGDAVTIVPG